MNSIGQVFRVSILGSSHGSLVGAIIDGVPAGVHLSLDKIQDQLNRRRPGQSHITTPRAEKDILVVETGILDGISTGDPILAYVRNEDKISRHYDNIKDTPRPGHADYPAQVKYKQANDHRGGGRFSGRLTVGLVIAGEIARQLLEPHGIEIISHTQSIGAISANAVNLDDGYIYSEDNLVRTADPDVLHSQIAYIEKLRKDGDSCGGIVSTIITGLPVGVGEPWFDSIESSLAHMLFSIPAVKGVDFGAGFRSTSMLGSEHNDEYFLQDDKIITRTNNAGGILGGMSNGMPVIFRTAFKPASSIGKSQQTVNLMTGRPEKLKVKGRHDPCVVPRAVPVVKGATLCVIYDLMRQGGFI